MLGFKQLKTGYAGFTLVEVLVSTLVLMVGILGVAAMQLVSFQNNQGAYLRSQAIYVASDYIARMRANPNGYNNTTVYDAVDTKLPLMICLALRLAQRLPWAVPRRRWLLRMCVNFGQTSAM